MLDVLLSNKTSEMEKRKILRDNYDIQMTQAMALEVSVMCNLSKGVEEKGIAKGMAKGRTEGMAKGITSGVLSSIKNIMETMNLSVDQAMIALKVPDVERQKYMELLEKQ